AHLGKGDHDKALTDYNKAIELDPKRAGFYLSRGNLYRTRGELDRATADYNRSIEIDPEDPEPYAARCAVHESRGTRDRALDDCRTALERTARSRTERQAHTDAQALLLRLQNVNKNSPVASASSPVQGSAPLSAGRRVALVIGNSNYASVGRL